MLTSILFGQLSGLLRSEFGTNNVPNPPFTNKGMLFENGFGMLFENGFGMLFE